MYLIDRSKFIKFLTERAGNLALRLGKQVDKAVIAETVSTVKHPRKSGKEREYLGMHVVSCHKFRQTEHSIFLVTSIN